MDGLVHRMPTLIFLKLDVQQMKQKILTREGYLFRKALIREHLVLLSLSSPETQYDAGEVTKKFFSSGHL